MKLLISFMTAVSLGLFVLVLAMLVRSRRRPRFGGDAALLGATGQVIGWVGGEGEILVQGGRWHARGDRPLVAGQQVRVLGRDGLTLRVEPK